MLLWLLLCGCVVVYICTRTCDFVLPFCVLQQGAAVGSRWRLCHVFLFHGYVGLVALQRSFGFRSSDCLFVNPLDYPWHFFGQMWLYIRSGSCFPHLSPQSAQASWGLVPQQILWRQGDWWQAAGTVRHGLPDMPQELIGFVNDDVGKRADGHQSGIVQFEDVCFCRLHHHLRN